MRTFRTPKYTYIKDSIYYFSSSVPANLICFYTKPRIIQSLRTNSHLRATSASKAFASKLDDYWLGLRLKSLDIPAAHLLVADGMASSLPTIEEALELYFSVKGLTVRNYSSQQHISVYCDEGTLYKPNN